MTFVKCNIWVGEGQHMTLWKVQHINYSQCFQIWEVQHMTLLKCNIWVWQSAPYDFEKCNIWTIVNVCRFEKRNIWLCEVQHMSCRRATYDFEECNTCIREVQHMISASRTYELEKCNIWTILKEQLFMQKIDNFIKETFRPFSITGKNTKQTKEGKKKKKTRERKYIKIIGVPFPCCSKSCLSLAAPSHTLAPLKFMCRPSYNAVLFTVLSNLQGNPSAFPHLGDHSTSSV